jgi:hypothetical protein
LRDKEPLAEELGLTRPEVTDDEILDAVMEHPVLIQRPLVETEKGAASAARKECASLESSRFMSQGWIPDASRGHAAGIFPMADSRDAGDVFWSSRVAARSSLLVPPAPLAKRIRSTALSRATRPSASAARLRGPVRNLDQFGD